MTYTFTCEQGHEPETLTVEDDNDDDAMQKMMTLAKSHLAQKHGGMPEMSDDEMVNMIKSNWKKEEPIT